MLRREAAAEALAVLLAEDGDQTGAVLDLQHVPHSSQLHHARVGSPQVTVRPASVGEDRAWHTWRILK